MEITEFTDAKKLLSRTKHLYKSPHRQAMKLRFLWTYEKPLTKSKVSEETRNLYKEICKYAEDDEKLSDVCHMITKGLKLNPKFHAFYAIKGNINMRQKRWTEAIKNFEDARSIAKFDKNLSRAQADILYNKQLIESYTQRGHLYYETGLLIEAASDYEQVITLSNEDEWSIDIQDKLLNILRRLDKYDAFRACWYQFISHANKKRAAILITLHAEYKIYLRDIVTARRMLLQALDLDTDNVQAQELLQIVYKIGHTMAMHTVIWCMHGSYEKALLTIEKGRDCDPYDPGYILLKTVVFRLSGRLTEAVMWLKNVDKEFYKFFKLHRDIKKSIFGELTVQQIKQQFIKQWYSIQYDIATKCMLTENYEQAYDILHANLDNHYREFCVLCGDSLLLRGHLHSALTVYLHCREKSYENSNHYQSCRKIYLIKRIIEILNNFVREAVRAKRSKKTINISEKILKVLDEEKIDVDRLIMQRAEALLHKSRGHLQISSMNIESRKSAADSLRFARNWTNTDLYHSLYTDMPLEQVIDQFAPTRNLPQSLKILMQYS